MRKKIIFLVLCLAVVSAGAEEPKNKDNKESKEKTFKVLSLQEVTAKGEVVKQQPFGGWITLYPDGRYKLKFHMEDEGTYKYAEPDKHQPKRMIFFYSKKKYTFYGHPEPGRLSVWISKTEQGNDIWLNTVEEKAVTKVTKVP